MEPTWSKLSMISPQKPDKENPVEVLQVSLKPYHWLREGHKPQNPDAPNFQVRGT